MTLGKLRKHHAETYQTEALAREVIKRVRKDREELTRRIREAEKAEKTRP